MLSRSQVKSIQKEFEKQQKQYEEQDLPAEMFYGWLKGTLQISMNDIPPALLKQMQKQGMELMPWIIFGD